MNDAKVSILLVDDRSENLLSLEALLACSDYELVSFRSGRDALREMEQRELAVVPLDVMISGRPVDERHKNATLEGRHALRSMLGTRPRGAGNCCCKPGAEDAEHRAIRANPKPVIKSHPALYSERPVCELRSIISDCTRCA
jgi:CheY-like chemotaxis protein